MLQPQTTLNGQVDAADQVRWSLPTRIAFRLCFCYLLPCGMSCLFNYALSQSQFTPTPFWKSFSAHDPWQGILPWVCRHVFNVHKKIMIIPDADLLSGYLQRLFQLILSLVITAIWSLVDRKRLNYRTLYGWLTLYLRFALAIALFNYGWDKVFPLQFRAVTPLRLIRPIGDLSLEGMLWTFMAASNPYTIFSGTLEVLAGALLLVPRLEMLGALLSVAVLGNVVALNYAYDIRVKMFSTHLLLISIFLAAPVLLHMADWLILRHVPSPMVQARLSNQIWIERGARIAMVVLAMVLCILSFTTQRARYAKRQAASVAAQTLPLHGVWVVDSFSVQSAGSPSLLTAKLQQEYGIGPIDHWIYLSFDTPKKLRVGLKENALDSVDFALVLDKQTSTGKMELTNSLDPAWNASLALQQTGENLLNMQGTVNGIPISAKLHRREIPDFPLTQEKIQFIQPEPEN